MSGVSTGTVCVEGKESQRVERLQEAVVGWDKRKERASRWGKILPNNDPGTAEITNAV